MMDIPKITKEQAKSFAFLITPYIKQYIQEHPDEYAAYMQETEIATAECEIINNKKKIEIKNTNNMRSEENGKKDTFRM